MAKITAEDLYKLMLEEDFFEHDVEDLSSLDKCDEEYQNIQHKLAKRINDFLVYGHVTKK